MKCRGYGKKEEPHCKGGSSVKVYKMEEDERGAFFMLPLHLFFFGWALSLY